MSSDCCSINIILMQQSKTFPPCLFSDHTFISFLSGRFLVNWFSLIYSLTSIIDAKRGVCAHSQMWRNVSLLFFDRKPLRFHLPIWLNLHFAFSSVKCFHPLNFIFSFCYTLTGICVISTKKRIAVELAKLMN